MSTKYAKLVVRWTLNLFIAALLIVTLPIWGIPAAIIALHAGLMMAYEWSKEGT